MLAQMVFFCSLLLTLLMLIIFSFSYKFIYKSEKMSPFECGFVPWANSRQSFSIQFFLIALIFLIFDVELILLFPFLISNLQFMSSISFFVFFLFLSLLTGGLLMEWSLAKLVWYTF